MRGIAQQGVVAGCCRGAGRGVDAQQHHLGQPLQGFALDPGQGPQGMKGLRIGFLMRFQRMPPDQNRGQPLLEQAEQVQGRWHANARGVLRDELFAQRRALSAQLLQLRAPDKGGRVQAWLAAADSNLSYTLSMFNEIRTQKSLDYPTISVAVRRLARLVAAGQRG